MFSDTNYIQREKMNKKQNSLMKFSRSERLAQLSEQESVIERKKREIQAKLEAQKRKETEEALRKLSSSKETKHNKADFSHKSSTRNRDEYKKEEEQEDVEKEEKQDGLTNAFSNDGSFLDHFKKISSTTRLASNTIDMKTLMSRKKEESDDWERDDRDIFRNKKEEDIHVEQRKDQESMNTKQPHLEKRFSEPNIQMPLPPPGVAQLIPQQRNSLMMPSTTSEPNPVPLIQNPDQLIQSCSLNSVPSFTKTNETQLKAMPSTSFTQTQQTLSSYPEPNIEVDTKESSLNQSSSASELSSIQPPQPMKPQNIPQPSPIQVQNIPPPPLPPKETGKTSVPLIKTRLKEFETDSSSSEDESSHGKRFKRKQFRSFINSGDKSKQGSATGSSVHFDSTSLPQSALRKEYSGVSSALYENDGDDEDDEDDGLTETHLQLAELVARCGDDFEDSLRNRKGNDPAVRFLSDKNSKQYLCYRKLVLKYRRNIKLKEEEEEKSKDLKLSTAKLDSSEDHHRESSEKNFSTSRSECRLSKEESKDDGSGQKNSQGENGSDKPRESKSRFDQKPSNSYQENNENLPYYKMPEGTSKEEDFSLVQKRNNQEEKELESSRAVTKEENGDETKTEERRKRKRKSRWGDAVASSSNVGPSLSLQPPGALPAPKTNLLSQLTRSDPGLVQYARQTFGSTNLSEEDWKKAEDHYKINLLYQNMVRKRAEIDKLEKAGKFKYEYDSDEDVEGGTWEHKLRQQEMMATQMWAEELTRQAAGKHHIGDFLPPEELERFMEKYNAVKEGREPDLSDYKEFKLKEDNVGYRLLQKMGWDEGQGLGQDGSGIKNPVNKATTRHENQGLGIERPDGLEPGDDEYDAYRKRMMLAYRFRPNPLNNPRRPYY